MDSKELVEKYKLNGIRIQLLEDKAKTKKKTVQEEQDKVWENIYDKRSQLDKEERDLRYDLELKERGIEEDTRIQTAPFELQRESVKRIVQFLEIHERFKPAEFRIGNKDIFQEWQDWVCNDDFLKIRLLVYENRKPVNKFTAAVYVACVFREPLIRLPFDCRDLGSFKTVEEARACAIKKKVGILQDVIEAVKTLKTEYTQVTNTYKLPDFDDLFEYSCSDCRATFRKVPGNHDREFVRYEGNTRIPVPVKCDGGRFYRQIMRGL